MTMLAIEMHDGDISLYGRIHAKGCRKLIDPETLGEANTTAEANDLAHDYTGWDCYDTGFEFSPCALKVLAQVQCAWFALCDNDATMTRPHPILGDVPICNRCDTKIDSL